MTCSARVPVEPGAVRAAYRSPAKERSKPVPGPCTSNSLFRGTWMPVLRSELGMSLPPAACPKRQSSPSWMTPGLPLGTRSRAVASASCIVALSRSCATCSSEERAAWCWTGGHEPVPRSRAEDGEVGSRPAAGGRFLLRGRSDRPRGDRSGLGARVERASSNASEASTRGVRAGDTLDRKEKGPSGSST